MQFASPTRSCQNKSASAFPGFSLTGSSFEASVNVSQVNNLLRIQWLETRISIKKGKTREERISLCHAVVFQPTTMVEDMATGHQAEPRE
ncbi:hypothetical protein MTO96_014247 [Rhipicephalus appendiculatus]